MKLIKYLKKSTPVLVLFVLATIVLNFGSYNPYNELSVLSPDNVRAMELNTPTLNTPTLNTPTLNTPTLNTPTLETPTLNTPTLNTPTLETPTLNTPTLDTPTLDTPTLNTPTLDTPTLDTPTLDTPTINTATSSYSYTSSFKSCKVTANISEVYVGSNITISWTTQGYSKVTLNGEVVDGPSGSKTFTNIQVNTTYTLVAETDDGTSKCISRVKITCLPVPPLAPTCTLVPTSATIFSGDSVDLSWTTNNAASVTLTDFGDVDLSGTQNTGALTANKSYWLTVLGTNGETVTCDSNIVVEPKPVLACELTLTKAVNTTTAKPGDELTYTINIKNTGTENCTGGGVKILDVLDENISFVSETHTTNLDAGYGSYPVYKEDIRTLFWNGNVLTPGEEGTITWKGKVNEAITCGTDVIIKNKAKATAKELSDFSIWSFSNLVETNVHKDCDVPAPKCELFSVAPGTIVRGNSAELAWSAINATRVVIDNGIGEVSATGTLSVTPLATSTYLLTVFGEDDKRDTCSVDLFVIDPPVEPVPMCTAFSATPFVLPFGGGESELKWTTKDGNKVVIEGIGEVNLSGSRLVNIATTTVYTLKVTDGKKEDLCQVTINVEPAIPAPTCTLTPATQTIVSGGNVDLVWTATNASTTSLTDFGAVTATGTKNTGVLTANKTYSLEVLGTNGETVSCTSQIIIESEPGPITCANNVNLSVSPSTFARGGSANISWSTTDITSLSFNNGITLTGLSGSVTVSPLTSTTYTLTATDGVDTISCPVPVTVTTGGGGGGGGSSSPRCELSVSDNKISRGDEIELKWSSRRANNLFILDSNNDTIVTTKGLFGDEKDDLFEGSIMVSPTKDTTYTMTVERGSRDKVCEVNVDVEDNIVVTQIRDQQPLIAGIALTQVPYTGFEAGPILTILFYVLLVGWALYIAYLFVLRRGMKDGFRTNAVTEGEIEHSKHMSDLTPAEKTDDETVDTVVSPVVSFPSNLPTGAPVIGYANVDTASETVSVTTPHNISDEIATELENHAHKQRVLLSSDAIRHFVATTENINDKNVVLDQVIASAKGQYPAEDGWLVINEQRMRELCLVCIANNVSSSDAPYIPTVIPEGSGSLAEAIVIGNIVAAYEMIGSRPMFALADAAAELDSLYCMRKGKKDVVVSELLKNETVRFTDEQIHEMITALTGALDGTYTDEAEAVKIAIMKAVKVVTHA